jgi:hypothetical protein
VRDNLEEIASVSGWRTPEAEAGALLRADRTDNCPFLESCYGRTLVVVAGANKMLIPHWLIGLAIFGALAAFIVFAFRQGLRVKPDRNKDPDEWSRYGGGTYGTSDIGVPSDGG